MGPNESPPALCRERWVYRSFLAVLTLWCLLLGVAQANTVRYAYDDARRMVKVTAPEGRDSRYSYDAGGRLVRTERDLDAQDGKAQTLITHRRYDVVDRVVAIAHVKRVGPEESVVAGQALTRAVGGAVTRIETYRSGTYDPTSRQFSDSPSLVQAFEFDRNGRLTRETRVAGAAGSDTTYEYDSVGNRQKRTITSSAGTEITHYSYDVNDRLVLESITRAAGGGSAITYGWDNNGNLASKTEPGRVTLYRFDPQSRLIDIRVGSTVSEAQAAAPTVRYAYDFKGNRVRQWTPGHRGYLIDPSYKFPQLALEETESESTYYVRGTGMGEILQQTRRSGAGTERLFPLDGHLGTSLGAVDANGQLVEQIDSDAFGNLDRSHGLKQTHIYTGEYWW